MRAEANDLPDPAGMAMEGGSSSSSSTPSQQDSPASPTSPRERGGVPRERPKSRTASRLARSARSTTQLGGPAIEGSPADDNSFSMELDVSIPWKEEELRAVFKKFSSGDDGEVHTEDIFGILLYLGARPSEEEVAQLIREFTRFASVNWQEFMDFVRRYREVDVQQLKEQFEAADLDGNGTLDEKELHMLLLSAGYSPTEAVTRESIEMLDRDGSGSLDFQEFEELREHLRKTRGFLKEEADELHMIFCRAACGSDEMPLEELHRIKSYLGYSIAAEELDSIAAKIDKDKSGTLRFDELLSVIRMIQDSELSSLVRIVEQYASPEQKAANRMKQKVFKRGSTMQATVSLNPEMSLSEYLHRSSSRQSTPLQIHHLEGVLADLGYYASSEVIQEILDAKYAGRQIDVLVAGEICDVLRAYRQAEGFTQKEVEELQDSFRREQAISVAGDDDETLDALELGRVLRWFGISKTLQQVRRLIEEVDFDGSQQLEFREFLKLMRQFLQDEAKQRREIFDSFTDADSGLMPYILLTKSLAEITGAEPDSSTVAAVMRNSLKAKRPALSRNEFEAFFKQYRSSLMEMVRQNAGFIISEVAKLRAIFDSYDENGKGYLGPNELRKLIEDHMPEAVMSKEGKEEMKQILAELPPPREARQTSHARSGSKSAGDAKKAQGCLDFDQFLLLMRRSYDVRDERDILREDQAIKACGYSMDEVEAFRQVFLSCVDSSGEMDMPVIITLLEKITSIDESETEELSQIVRQLNPERREVLRFPQFLQLMHSITSQNLFGLNTTAEQLADAERVRKAVRKSIHGRSSSKLSMAHGFF